ncbi:MAG: DUF4388 domain-containing protein [Cyanobacteriota bacterium]
MENESNQELVNRLNLLLEINATINSTRNLGELLTKITNTTSVVMKSEASSIALLDAANNELVFQFVHGEFGDQVRTIRVEVGKGISGWVAKYGVPLIVPDAQKDPRFNNKVDEKTTFVTRSVICVPLKREERVIGILQSLNKKDGGQFGNDDLAIFESLANIASIAIENAQLYEILNQRLVQLEEAKQRTEYILNQLKQSEKEMSALRELSKQRGAFMGKLGTFRVENLVQMLGNDYKTGKLSLINGAEKGYIYLKNGKLMHSYIEDKEVEGLESFYETICWLEGEFSFQEGETHEDVTIDKMAMSIIIEGLRRFDESNALRDKYKATFVPKHSFEDNSNLGEPQENDPPKISILKAINGVKNVEHIFKASPFGRYTFYTTLKELDEAKMISFYI